MRFALDTFAAMATKRKLSFGPNAAVGALMYDR
jgi:hypothetical protein